MKPFLSLLLALFYLPANIWSQQFPSKGDIAGPEKDENFSHSVITPKKPWTKREFKNDPNDFQFAIVTDRTGGLRPGVFPRAVKKVNELQPEFVITVGDLITGGTRQRNEKIIRAQWEEFNRFVDDFEMPFFYLPGNHDVSNPLLGEIWDEMYGVRYYSFVYKDVFFLCLNAQDNEKAYPRLGEEQIAWAKKEITKHADARWTMVFVHQPLWLLEEGIPRNINGEKVLKKSNTGWPEIEEALSGRDHTVYAGHVHRYAKYKRNEANYYTLGTTGGGSALRGSTFGEFDHASWITMTDEGPRMMNLTLDGMLEEDVTTEAKQKFWRGFKFTENFRETFPFKDKIVTLPIENPLETKLSGQLSWVLPFADHWTVSPRRIAVDLAPGEKTEIKFKVSHKGNVATYFPLPRLDAHLHGEDEFFHLEKALSLPLDLTDHVKKYPRKTQMTATPGKPLIDGDLNEDLWNKKPTIDRLIPRQADGYAPVNTQAWLCYDDSFLYIAVKCEEPIVRDILSEVKSRDGDLKDDDSIEILFDTNSDKKSFHHFAVNPKGVLYDAQEKNASWNSTALVATGKEANSWTVEMAIPLEEIGADFDSHKVWGFQIARHRPKRDDKKSYQWSPTFWYGNTLPSFFGRLMIR